MSLSDAPSLDLPEFAPGSVWLVGAGPGDPGLVTVLALHALLHADVIVYDALVDRRVLELKHASAAVEYAGKRGGRPSAQQEDISLRLIRLAYQGKRVLRLKGGDPFVFGRGGEEAMALKEAGVPFRIVPGITAAIGGLAYAGIPATHRDVNHSFAFVSGHKSGGALPAEVDWAALSRAAPTIVVYMAMGHLGEVTQRLIAAGRGTDEPAAVVAKRRRRNSAWSKPPSRAPRRTPRPPGSTRRRCWWWALRSSCARG